MARDLTVPAWGIMNMTNALGVFVLLREFGLSDAEIAHGLALFKGVARRQELIGEAAGITVIDDFAHHPDGHRGHAGGNHGALSRPAYPRGL